MRVKSYKNGTQKITFSRSKRCECGCGEGVHVVAAMCGRKCCDACDGTFRPVEKRTSVEGGS